LAWRTSLVVCPLRNRTRSAPTTRNFVVDERSQKCVAIFGSAAVRGRSVIRCPTQQTPKKTQRLLRLFVLNRVCSHFGFGVSRDSRFTRSLQRSRDADRDIVDGLVWNRLGCGFSRLYRLVHSHGRSLHRVSR